MVNQVKTRHLLGFTPVLGIRTCMLIPREWGLTRRQVLDLDKVFSTITRNRTLVCTIAHSGKREFAKKAQQVSAGRGIAIES